MKERLLQKIPNRTDANIIALYTDYASDKDGDYSFVLGAKVTDGGQVPSGMVLKRIPFLPVATPFSPATKVQSMWLCPQPGSESGP